MTRRLAVMTLACASCAATQAGAPKPSDVHHLDASGSGKYFAVIVGVGQYTHYDALDASATDATALERVLRDDYGYEHVWLLPPNATAEQIRAELKTATDSNRMREPDHLLVYFSGHGKSGRTRSSGYWLPSNALKMSEADALTAGWTSDAAHWIGRDYVVGWLDEQRPAHILVIDDSCFSGSVRLPSGDIAQLASEAQTTPAPTAMVRAAMDETLPGGGFRVGGSSTSRAVRWLSAGGDEQVASSSDKAKPSLFTKYLLDVLENNEGAMNGQDVFGAVKRRMENSGERQTPDYRPIFEAGHKGGDFLFIKKGWIVDQVELGLGRVAVRVAKNAKSDAARDKQLRDLVVKQLQETDAQSRTIRPGKRPRPLFLSISSPVGNAVVLTLIDRETEQILGRVNRALAAEGEALAANLHTAVTELRGQAEDQLYEKEISVDIVRRALIAQMKQRWDLYMVLGPGGYIGNDLLRSAAFSLRGGGDANLTPWLLLGPTIGFDWTRSHTTRSSFIGDLANGTYANNNLEGTAILASGSVMGRATVRRPHGLVLPFAHASMGAAYLRLRLSEEHFVPVTSSDTLPANLVNQRSDAASLAFAWEAGAGVAFRLSQRASLVAEAQYGIAYHGMVISSEIQGVNQSKPVSTAVQSIATVSIRAGAALHF